MSSGLGMCDRLNSLVCTDRLPVTTQALGRYWERVDYSLTFLSFASFNAPYNPVRFMYGKRTASIQFLILCLIILCALWSQKHGNYSQTSFIWTMFRQKMSVWRGILKIGIRPVATGSIRWKSSLNFFALLQILFHQENFLLKNIIKTEVETNENVCATLNF